MASDQDAVLYEYENVSIVAQPPPYVGRIVYVPSDSDAVLYEYEDVT